MPIATAHSFTSTKLFSKLFFSLPGTFAILIVEMPLLHMLATFIFSDLYIFANLEVVKYLMVVLLFNFPD